MKTNIFLSVLSIFVANIQAKNKELRRVIEGQESIIRRPYQVQLWHVNEYGQPMFQCAGSIIHPQWIITAAHCLKSMFPDRMGIIAGTNILVHPWSQLIPWGSKTYRVQRFAIHESPVVNDIAMIKVQGYIEYSNEINPIRISMDGIIIGTRATIAGWGRSKPNEPLDSKLQEIYPEIISIDQCRRAYGSQVTNMMVCTQSSSYKDAYFVTVNQGACNGDSGGPLVYNGNLLGIVSFGSQPCAIGFPDVYTLVPAYIQWIQYVIDNIY